MHEFFRRVVWSGELEKGGLGSRMSGGVSGGVWDLVAWAPARTPGFSPCSERGMGSGGFRVGREGGWEPGHQACLGGVWILVHPYLGPSKLWEGGVESGGWCMGHEGGCSWHFSHLSGLSPPYHLGERGIGMLPPAFASQPRTRHSFL